MGTVALPTLNERGFSKKLSLGSLAAGGTMGILIPPSIALIIYGSLTNNSISQLFVAGVIPGIALTLTFIVYLMFASMYVGTTGTIVVSWSDRLKALPAMVPPLVIFFIVMGSIYFGLATPTESAALGIMASLFFAWRTGRLSAEMLHKCFVNTAQLTGMIILIITAAFILNLTLSLLGIAEMLTQSVMSLDLTLTQLTLVMIVFYIVLGMFLDVLSIQVATIPIAYPIMTAAGADPIWFGIFIVLMSEVAMITPPMLFLPLSSFFLFLFRFLFLFLCFLFHRSPFSSPFVPSELSPSSTSSSSSSSSSFFNSFHPHHLPLLPRPLLLPPSFLLLSHFSFFLNSLHHHHLPILPPCLFFLLLPSSFLPLSSFLFLLHPLHPPPSFLPSFRPSFLPALTTPSVHSFQTSAKPDCQQPPPDTGGATGLSNLRGAGSPFCSASVSPQHLHPAPDGTAERFLTAK